VFAGVDLSGELARYGTVFEAVGHGKSASSRSKADVTAFLKSVTSAADGPQG
jgi:hypothetical protein